MGGNFEVLANSCEQAEFNVKDNTLDNLNHCKYTENVLREATVE